MLQAALDKMSDGGRMLLQTLYNFCNNGLNDDIPALLKSLLPGLLSVLGVVIVVTFGIKFIKKIMK